MSKIYAQQKRPGAKAPEPSYSAPAVHAPSLVSGQSSSDLDALMQAKYRQHFLDNQIPTAEAEADRIAASVSGAGTPDEVKAQLGEKMGADFSGVTFHTDSTALKQADAMGARAYTSGSDVYFGSGGFDPGVAAHELVHTVQQGMVGSAMQTTSAPTGGVQMMPNFLKKLFSLKTSNATPEETEHNMNSAKEILSGIISTDHLNSEHAQMAKHYFSSIRNPQNDMHFSMDGQTLVTREALDTQYAEALSNLEQRINSPHVNLTGIDGTAALKSAKGAKLVADDFKGLDLRNITVSPIRDFSSLTTLMDANPLNREVRISRPHFQKTRFLPHTHRTKGQYGFNTANNNYSLVHELGHIVNFQLADKFDQDSYMPYYGKTVQHSTTNKSTAITNMILADILANQAGQDKKLQKLLSKNVKLKKGESFTDQTGLRAIADAMKTSPKGQDSKLLKALNKGGYTSKYGATNSLEFYAEAFADHYRNETKEAQYQGRPDKANKLAMLRNERNIISDLVIQRSRELFDDKDKRDALRARFG